MTATLQRLWEPIGRDHLVWLAALCILLSGALLALLLVALLAQELRSAERSLDAFARAMEEMTSHTLQAAHSRLELVAHEITHPVPQNDGLVTRKLLQERLHKRPFASDVWVLDANGKVRTGTAPGSAGIDACGRDYFLALHNAKPGAVLIGKPAFGAADRHWRTPMAHALRDTGGRFLGAVFAGVDPAHLSTARASVDLGADAAGVRHGRSAGGGLHCGDGPGTDFRAEFRIDEAHQRPDQDGIKIPLPLQGRNEPGL